MNFILTSIILLFVSGAGASVYQDGDIIFQESQSAQSKAIQEATSSRWSHVGIVFSEKGNWYVAEAVQPVKVTPLTSFIARGKNGDYRVYRVPGLSDSQKQALRNQVRSYLGKDYDIYFEWSDDLIYCSELVYKAFAAAGVEIGIIQKFEDLKLDGPYIKELIRRRLKDTGRSLNLKESIVTPVTQLRDQDLVLVESVEH